MWDDPSTWLAAIAIVISILGFAYHQIVLFHKLQERVTLLETKMHPFWDAIDKHASEILLEELRKNGE